MSFLKKTWLARIGVGLNRFRMNNSTDVVLESNPISVTQQGDQLSADNMNNLETRIDNAFTEMAGNLATIEVSPSQHNWTVGSQIVYNGILYKVTSAISTDDNLVVGTNISPYPVSSALSDITASIKLVDSNNYDTSDSGVNRNFTITESGLYVILFRTQSKYASNGQTSINATIKVNEKIKAQNVTSINQHDGIFCVTYCVINLAQGDIINFHCAFPVVGVSAGEYTNSTIIKLK